MMKYFMVVIILAAVVGRSPADTVTMLDGRTITGVVLRNDAAEVKIRTDGGTIGFDPDKVDKVEVVPVITSPSMRVADWTTCLSAFVKDAFDGKVDQIPATVVDKGILANVPYISFRSGGYEMNIYGDPAKPACVEIGMYGQLTSKLTAQSNCRAFIKTILGVDEDRELVGVLADGETKVRDGWKLEVTTPKEDDSYGGWWVSVYSEPDLDHSRASVKELAAITVARPAQSGTTSVISSTKTDSSATPANDDNGGYAPADFSYARPSTPTSDGRVFVSGYTRKNGTYVAPYTRKR